MTNVVFALLHVGLVWRYQVNISLSFEIQNYYLKIILHNLKLIGAVSGLSRHSHSLFSVCWFYKVDCFAQQDFTCFPFVYIRAIFLKGGSERLDMSRVRPGLRRHTVSLVLPLGAGAITGVYSELGWLHSCTVNTVLRGRMITRI